jgi:hypothetical protein
MRTILFAVSMMLATLAAAAEQTGLPFVWSDQTGTREMPWMGKGGRAHWYVIDKTKPWDIMNPRGPTLEWHWGSSGRSGTSPYEDADRAMSYLASVGFMKRWPVYPEDSSQKDAIALPYRITIVSIQPVVAILRFDLSAAIEDPIEFAFGALPASHREHSTDQELAWSKTPNRIMIGTHVASNGALLWFCPEANVPPTPLDLSSGRAQIALKDFRLDVEKKGEELEFSWRAR